MKTTRLALMASLGALMLCGSAFAGTASYAKNPVDKNPTLPPPEVCGPWFAGFNAGVWWVEDYGTNVPFVGIPGDHEFSFETGFGLHGMVGYRLSEMVSISLEGGFLQADTDAVTLPAGLGTFAATDGQLRLFPITLNAAVNVPITDRLSFYASFGGGPVYRELEATVPAVALLTSFHDSGWDMMIQARGGLAYEVARCTYVNVGYRWNHVFTSPDDINGHMVEAGFTFMWH